MSRSPKVRDALLPGSNTKSSLAWPACYDHRMFARLALAALLLATASVPGQAGGRIIGAGVPSCGVWIAEHPQGRNSDQLDQWVLGYLSGENQHLDVDILKNTDAQAIIAWVSRYCAQNPLDNIHDASLSLVVALAKRERR